MKLGVTTSTLKGDISIPPSKSHTLRAILFASLASGDSTIINYLKSPDTDAMIRACSLFGANIQIESDRLFITGTAGNPQLPNDVIDSGNSGQVLRFIAAVAALTRGYTILTGDQSIRNNRPVQPLLDGLNQLKVFAASSRNNGYAPIIVKGPIQPGHVKMNGEDSQPVSGILISSAFTKGVTEIHVENPGETPWIDLTLDWFKRLNIEYQCENYTYYRLKGHSEYQGFNYCVPGDFSSAAFPIVAAVITGSEISVHNLDMHDVQGDKAIIPVLENMGAKFNIDHKNKRLDVKSTKKLLGIDINVNRFIDAVTILAVVGCFASGKTCIKGAEIARKKESNRLETITSELNKMGARVNCIQDGLVIQPSTLSGANVESYHDHRIAMSLAVAGLAAEGETHINDTACIAKSYPDFATSMRNIGANISESV